MANTHLTKKPQKGSRRGGKVAYHGGARTRTFAASAGRTEATAADERWERTRLAHTLDETMGFSRYDSGKAKEGWLVNIQPTALEDEKNNLGGRSALDCYFIEEDGGTFKATVEYEPYFYIAVRKGHENEVEEWIKRVAGPGLVKQVRRIEREDLSTPNHLVAPHRPFLELRFANVPDLLAVRKVILPIAQKNQKMMDTMDTYAETVAPSATLDMFDDDIELDTAHAASSVTTASEYIVDIREYDVPYHVRVMIDLNLRVGKWYIVEAKHGVTTITVNEDRLAPADPVVLAFDIETTKAPLKFPDATVDQIMMISYMIDGQGFLVTNRQIISEDIADFEYTPKPEYPGYFLIFNEPDEKAVLERFFTHIKEARPTVIATYNGDFFDWPFVEARAAFNGIDMYREIGWRKDPTEDVYKCNYSNHMDCFAWVNRDSYLPQGSRGLKAVTVAKLGYDPDELDPELMTPYARERPQTLAEYSVSDAVATYYLYMKYIHPFIFSLSSILPLNPDDSLRKGTGTLCEMLLMVQAYEQGIAIPNKHTAPKESFWNGHLLESETYVGGHVESIEAGVFRADIPVNFAVDPGAVEELIKDLDAALRFSVTVEEQKKMEDVENYDEVRGKIEKQLRALIATPNRLEEPLIYHLDVASMYPNIMATNRLQPDSMIQESQCAACDFNRPGKTCDRRLPWAWRGEYLPAKRDEYNMIRNALEHEKFPGRWPNSPMRTFHELGEEERATMIRKRLQLYSQKVYHKIHDSTVMVKEAIICQRENPFYINTVRSFRDRRYDYKGKARVWKGKASQLKSAGAPSADVENAKKMVVLFDSLQLAHKVILNSFYGYVMRKGSRWYSMSMAGVTCLTGATIIQMAKELVERLGRPLELDTDGIWCMLPGSFPENFSFQMKGGKKVNISYPCVMLNHLVHARFTNHQYQTLVDPKTLRYETHSDNSIFFEVDGPYKAMVLPTSKEEDKNLKKRYAVFNHDGSLAELKGFEVKRRGELKLIKIFQQQIFKFFLDGTTLTECYQAVATVANRWLDVLYNKGTTLSNEELMELISENRSMSKTLEEYGSQKSTSITTAKRLADFLGAQMVKDKGLNCKFIICSKPRNAPVTERAIPIAIFSAPDETKHLYLRKWLREDPQSTDPRALIDWEYYLERLGSVIQKLITIPAALQKVRNPVPRIAHPEWLQRRINQKEDKMKQVKITNLFSASASSKLNKAGGGVTVEDLEDFGTSSALMKNKTLQDAILSSQAIGVVATAEAETSPQKRKATQDVTPSNSSHGTHVDHSSDNSSKDGQGSLPSQMPDPSEDYVAFLQYQKIKWKQQKEARVRRRHLFGDRRGPIGMAGNGGSGTGAVVGGTGAGGSNVLRNTFMRQAHTTFMNTWQILHLKRTENPGQVTAYVLIDAKIHTLKINVPRQVFVNFRSYRPPPIHIRDCIVEPVPNYVLPNGHAATNLVKLTLPEEVFVEEMQRPHSVLRHRLVEGVYEAQLPLNMRAVLHLGNLCTIDEQQHSVLGRGLEHGFDLTGLKRPAPSVGKKPKVYLDAVPLGFVYITHIVSGDRQIFGLFSTTSPHSHIVILQKSRDGGQEIPNISRLYTDRLALHLEEKQQQQQDTGASADLFSYQEKLDFKVTTLTNKRKAYLEISDVIKKFRKDELRPQILVMQSAHRSSLVHDIPVLAEFPTLSVKHDIYDGTLPALGWQAVVAKRVVGHYLGLSGELGHYLTLSRYADVPLCNLEKEDPRFLIDVAYARRLQQNNVILWWSGASRPDHAGYEKDDVTGPLEQVQMPFVNHPGTYMSVCIEMEVRNLAINTLLTSSLINALEGADGEVLGSGVTGVNPNGASQQGGPGANAAMQENSGLLGQADGSFSSASVQVLKELVKSWWSEACKGSPMADLLVNHLLRWVEDADSYLYDRALHHYVQMICRKAFQQLMTDFRRVSCQVVFANANRLILQTTKADVENAYAFGHYIIKSIKAQPLFHFIDLEIKEYWDFLVWYDEYNYGGVGCEEIIEAEQQDFRTVMHWQMQTFLPTRLQPTFSRWIVEFINLMHAAKRPPTDDDGGPPRLTQLPLQRIQQDPRELTLFESLTQAEQKDDVGNMQIITGKAFEKPLKKEIAALLSQHKRETAHVELADDYNFPTLPGSHLAQYRNSRQAVVELVKSILQVLSLDKNIQMEVRLLRKELLQFFDIREFSKDAAFRNPSESLRLAHLSCENCAMPRELDLCRDEDLLPDVGTDGRRLHPDTKQWACPACGFEFSRMHVEERLIAATQAYWVEWVTQDQRCRRCRTIRLNEFMEHCTCSGEWVDTVEKSVVLDRLQVYRNVARYYELRMLESVVAEMLSSA